MGARRGHRAGAWPVFAAACSAIAAPFSPQAWAASSDPGDGVHVLYHEKLQLSATAGAGERKANAGEIRHVTFEAYGRRFELALERNGRLDAGLARMKSGTGADLKLYRGTVNDAPGSWVRLASRGADIHGMLWDGEDLYVMEPFAAVEDAIVPAAPGGQGNVIFRLADTLLRTGALSCATSGAESQSKGAAVYASLVQELKGSRVMMQAAGANLRLELSALGDALFRQRYADEPQASEAILVRLNNVDGIFSSQLGVEIQVPLVDIMDAASDPLSDTTNAKTLLGDLGRLRRSSPALRARGLTHLFTGRDLDGSTVGMAYVDSLCREEQGAGLTEVNGRGPWLESLIAAHEIGHNFGAVHDGEGVCASTPTVFLMAPGVDSNRATFSQCSLDSMLPRVYSAQCITPLAPADVAVAPDLGTVQHTVATSFEWALTVANIGGLAAAGVRAEILVPPSMSIDDAWVSGGSCTAGAGVIACELGEIAGGSSRNVHLALSSDTVGSNSISARVSAVNDSEPSNNNGDGTLVIAAEADPKLEPPSSPSSASTSSGGGGAFGPLLLAALGGIARARKPGHRGEAVPCNECT